VNHILRAAELLSAAEALAKKIIEKAPLAGEILHGSDRAGVELPQEEGLFLEATLFGLCCATEDMREARKRSWKSGPRNLRGSRGNGETRLDDSAHENLMED